MLLGRLFEESVESGPLVLLLRVLHGQLLQEGDVDLPHVVQLVFGHLLPLDQLVIVPYDQTDCLVPGVFSHDHLHHDVQECLLLVLHEVLLLDRRLLAHHEGLLVVGHLPEVLLQVSHPHVHFLLGALFGDHVGVGLQESVVLLLVLYHLDYLLVFLLQLLQEPPLQFCHVLTHVLLLYLYLDQTLLDLGLVATVCLL